jgi:hypothetical protein
LKTTCVFQHFFDGRQLVLDLEHAHLVAERVERREDVRLHLVVVPLLLGQRLQIVGRLGPGLQQHEHAHAASLHSAALGGHSGIDSRRR